MIALASSVLVAIIKGEPEAEQLLDLLAAEECALGAPTLVETRAWCAINLARRASQWLEHVIDAGPVSVIPFNREMADAASQAFATFGRASGHPAKLNFGDCMAYAVSAILRAPLLFKGRDLALTDVMAHPSSIRV
jgi:ribonuclease VapC